MATCGERSGDVPPPPPPPRISPAAIRPDLLGGEELVRARDGSQRRVSFALSPPPPPSRVASSDGVIHLNVSAQITVLRCINTPQQTFECVLVLITRWREQPSHCGEQPSRCGEQPSHCGEQPSRCGEQPSHCGEQPSLWQPRMFFTNSVGDVRVMHDVTMRAPAALMLGAAGGVQAVHTLIVCGEFAEHFEVRQFPIDFQRLHINVKIMNCPAAETACNRSSSHHARGRVSISEPEAFTSRAFGGSHFALERGDVVMSEDAFVERHAWRVVQDMQLVPKCSSQTHNSSGTAFCKFVIHLTVARKPAHYFWYFVFPVSMQALVVSLTVLMAPDDISGKAQVAVSVVLTMFAIKFTCAQYLPTVAYMTYLDNYFVAASVYVFAMVLQNVCVFWVAASCDKGDAALVNYTSGGLLTGVWAAVSAAAYAVLLSHRLRSRLIVPEVDGEPADAPTRLRSVLGHGART